MQGGLRASYHHSIQNILKFSFNNYFDIYRDYFDLYWIYYLVIMTRCVICVFISSSYEMNKWVNTITAGIEFWKDDAKNHTKPKIKQEKM